MELIDERTGEPVVVGSVLRSVERGDLLVVESIAEESDFMGGVAVKLVPLGKSFTAYARHDDEEPSGMMLQGYWLA